MKQITQIIPGCRRCPYHGYDTDHWLCKHPQHVKPVPVAPMEEPKGPAGLGFLDYFDEALNRYHPPLPGQKRTDHPLWCPLPDAPKETT